MTLRRLPILLLAALLAPFLALAGARGAAAQETDEWSLVYMDEAKIGFSHTVIEKVEIDGRVLWRSSNDTSMNFNRFGQSIRMDVSGWSLEDESGAVVEIQTESNMAASKSMVRVRVEGGKAELTRRIGEVSQLENFDWKPEWLGDVEIDRRNTERMRAGETAITFEHWMPDAGPTVSTLEVLGRKEVDVPGLGTRELLQVRHTMDSQPGVVTDLWLDEEFEEIKSVTRMMGMNLIGVPASKADCLAAVENPDTPEVFNRLSPRSNVRLPDPYGTDEVVLRLEATDPAVPLPKLEDERQAIVERISKDAVILRVSRVVPDREFTLPLAGLTEEETAALASNPEIDSADPRIVEMARAAVGGETDAWKAAGRLERHVFEYITDKNMKSLLEPASKVLESRAGDCTEHGVLLAALCRAAGIPARVAVGLLYFQGIWGGHMWAEVSLGGKWYALDGVLGQGSVDAGHLRLAADTLNSAQIGAVFANVGLGMTMKMDILSYRHGDREVEVGEEMEVHEIDGDTWRHLLYGVSLTAPEGCAIEPNESIRMGDNELVKLEGDGFPEIELEAIDVGYDFSLEKVKDLLAAQGVTRLKAEDVEIDGRPGRVLRGKKSRTDFAAAVLLREQTLFVLSAKLDGDDDESVFEDVLATLDLED